MQQGQRFPASVNPIIMSRALPTAWGALMRGNSLMAFRPLHDRVVVRRVDSEEKTAGGIIFPDTAKEKPQEGEIIASGTGARKDNGEIVALDVKAGDRVLFG